MRQGPDYIQFYPTLHCNRSCNFCFNRSLASMDHMPVSFFRAMLGRLPPSVRTLDIIGGEPTLHPGIVPLLQAASSAGLRVNLSSNGSNVSVLQAIASTEPDITIGVSVNDHAVLNGLSRFIKVARPVVKTVYSRSLAPSLVRTIMLLEPKAFYYIFRDATGPHDLAETIPFPDFLSAVSRSEPRAGTVYCSGFLPDTAAYPDLASVRCPAGTAKLGVLPDGSVYPCNLLFGRPEFLLGNILTDPFEVIWNHPVLNWFRSFTQNRCPRRECRHHAKCHGGCPAQSLLLTADVNAPDPRCIPA